MIIPLISRIEEDIDIYLCPICAHDCDKDHISITCNTYSHYFVYYYQSSWWAAVKDKTLDFRFEMSGSILSFYVTTFVPKHTLLESLTVPPPNDMCELLPLMNKYINFFTNYPVFL